MSTIPTNYLAVEPLLIARLQTELGAAVDAVGGVAEFEAALDNPDSATPAAYVLYAGDRAVENAAGRGSVLRPQQLWQVGLRTRPAIDTGTGRASMVESGQLMTQVIAAVAGWRPADGFQAARRVQERGQPVYYADGVALIVLDFEIGVPVTLET